MYHDLVPLTVHVQPKRTKGAKMYIQDEKQKIVGNLAISGEWGECYQTSRMWTNVLVLPEIGAYVTYQGNPYRILTIRVYLDKVDAEDVTEKTGNTIICRILRITDEGDDMGESPIEVKAYELALI
jgi:hypothetical protein